MPRVNGSRVTLRIALDAALASAQLLVDRHPDCAGEWREVCGWIEAAQNDLRTTCTPATVPATFTATTDELARYLDGQLALAASLVESLAIGEAQRASEHAQRRARSVPDGGPVRNGVRHAAK